MKVLKRIVWSCVSVLLLVTAFYYSGPTSAPPHYDVSLPAVHTPLELINDSLLNYDRHLNAEPCALSSVVWQDGERESEYVVLYCIYMDLVQHSMKAIRSVFGLLNDLRRMHIIPELLGTACKRKIR